MQERLPAVHKKKIWAVVGLVTLLAFFLLWTMTNQGTPAKLEQRGIGDAVPVAPSQP